MTAETHGSTSPRHRFLPLLAATLLALFLLPATAGAAALPSNFFPVVDTGGPNDEPSQSDLTQMARDDSLATEYRLLWSWDATDDWTGAGQTGDACALFDYDGDSKVNNVICIQVDNTVPANPGLVQMTAGSPFAFTCDDVDLDRCDQPIVPMIYTPADLKAGALGTGTGDPGVSPPANLITNTDPFVPNPGDGTENYPNDTTVMAVIRKAFLPLGAELVNVCSYPSAGAGGNNNPFDCIVNTGSGFLRIQKVAPNGTTQTFNFTVNPGANQQTRSIVGSGTSAGGDVALAVGNTHSVQETVPTGWNLDSASCALQGGTGTGTYNSTTKTVGSVQIESGKVTTCTFTNSPNPASFTVKKDAVPNHPQSFSFVGPDGGFELVDNGVAADAKLDYTTSTSFGQKVFREVGETGWDLANITCTQPGDVEIGFWDGSAFQLGAPGGAADTAAYESGDNAVRIDIQPGEALGECTFRNDAQASTFTVTKDAVPNGTGQSFTFAGPNGNFELLDAGSLGVSTTSFGTRIYREVGETDWTLANITCTLPGSVEIGHWDGTQFLLGAPGGAADTAAFEAGDNAVRVNMQPGVALGDCTFTNNADPASITVTKNATVNHAQDFGFTTQGGGLSNFTLDDDSGAAGEDTTNSSTTGSSFTNLTDFGLKYVTENAVADWSLTNIVCSGSATITIGRFVSNVFQDGGNATYDSGDTTARIDVQPGKTASCTFTNTPDAGGVTAVKNATVNHAQDFGFTTQGGGLSNFTLDDDSGAAGEDSTNASSTGSSFTSLTDFGLKYVTENATADWSLTNIVCSGDATVTIGRFVSNVFQDGGNATYDSGDTTARIDVQPGKDASCTFTNTPDAGGVTVTKNATVNHQEDFGFTTQGGGLSNFTLDDDSGAAGEDTTYSTTTGSSFTGLTDFGVKDVTEDPVPNWTLTNIVCTGDASVTIGRFTSNSFGDGGSDGFDAGDTTARINVQPGKDASCTFTNTPDAGGVTAVKNATVNHAQDFGFTTQGGGLSNFTLDDDSGAAGEDTTNSDTTGSSFTSLTDFGLKYVTENTVADWSLTNIVCSGSATVTIGRFVSNVFQDGGNASYDSGDTTARIDVQPGKSASCTFTNTPDAGGVTVTKNATVNHQQDFGFTTQGGGLSNFTLDDDSGAAGEDTTNSDTTGSSFTSLTDFGTKYVTENTTADWSLTNIVCTGDATVTVGRFVSNVFQDGGNATYDSGDTTARIDVQPGKDASCTFTNTPDAGGVTVVKNATVNHAQDFGFTTQGGGLSSFTLDDDSGAAGEDSANSNTTGSAFTGLTDFGVKDVTETAAADWSLTNIVCTGDASVTIGRFTSNVFGDGGSDGFDAGDTTARINVQPGKDASCTFTNTPDPGGVTVTKNATVNHAQDFGFTTQGGGLSNFTLDDDSGAAGEDTANASSTGSSFTSLTDFGLKYVSENAVADWSLTNIVCTGDATVTIGRFVSNVFQDGGSAAYNSGDTTARIDVQPGKDASCTFTNTPDAGGVTVTKNATVNHQQDFGFTTQGGGLSNFTLDDDSGAAGEDTTYSTTTGSSFTGLTDFGTKDVTESSAADWSLTNIVCSGDATVTIGRFVNNVFQDGGSATFDAGDTTARIDVQPGKDAACTFTNTPDAGGVTAVKNATVNHAQDFGFTTQGAGLNNFTLDDDSGAAGEDSTNSSTTGSSFTALTDFGLKYVTENTVADWSLTNVVCTGDATVTVGRFVSNVFQDGGSAAYNSGDTTARIDVQPGKDASCTFTNTPDPGGVTVTKNATVNHAQDFGFTTQGGGLSNFTLDDDSGAAGEDTTNSNTTGTSFTSLTDFGTKYVTENNVADWSLTNIVCTGDATVTVGRFVSNAFQDGGSAAYNSGDTTARIDVQPGKDASCTFTNTPDPGGVTVTKNATVNHAQNFGFTTQGASLSNFTLDDDSGAAGEDTANASSTGTSFTGLTAFGLKYVTEDTVADWSLTNIVCTGDATVTIGRFVSNVFQDGGNAAYDSGDTTARIDVQPGKDAACTFTNTPDAASVSVIKNAAPDHPQNFQFAQTGLTGEDATFQLDDDSDGALDETKPYANRTDFGKKVISETAAANWTLTNIVCTGDADVRIGKLDNGAFTLGNGGTAAFAAGDTAVEVDLQPGKSAECTFTNTADPGLAVIVKDAAPNHEQNFSFQQTGLTGESPSFQLDDDADSGVSNTQTYSNRTDFGTKLITETPAANWTLTNIACTGTADVRYGKLDNGAFTLGTGGTAAFEAGDTTVEVDLQPGKTATCTFTNTASPASLTVVKNAAPDHEQDFGFRQTGLSGEGATFNLDDDSNGTLSNTKPYADRSDFGKKVVSEDGGVAGWTLTNIACTGTADVRYGKLDNGAFTLGTGGTAAFEAGDTAVEVDLQPGKASSCTFTNTAAPASLTIVKDADPNAAQDFGFRQTGLTGEGPTFNLDDDSNGTLSNTQPYANRTDFGKKVVSEDGLAGWALKTVACTGSATVRIGELDNAGAFTLGGGTSAFQAGDTAVEVDLQPGKTATCTFTNDADEGAAAVVKSGNEFAYHGDNVTFEFVVTNPGTVPLRDVTVADDKCPKVTGPVKQVNAGGADDLDPGDRWVYNCTMPVPAHSDGEANPFKNVVTLSAKDPQDRPVGATDDHLTKILHPAIDVDKTGPADATAGTRVEYAIVVTNPGDVAFAADRVAVQDTLCEAPPALIADGKRRGDGPDPTPESLDPGDTWVYSCTVQTLAGQERVDNVADVTGTDFNGRNVSDSDSAATVLRQPVQQSAPQRATPGSARLAGPANCVNGPFRVMVRGEQIAAVTLFIGKRKVRTLRAPQATVLRNTKKRVLVGGKVQTVTLQSQQAFRFTIDPRRLSRGQVHRVSARVVFTTESGTQSRRLKFAFRRCQAARKPQFTG